LFVLIDFRLMVPRIGSSDTKWADYRSKVSLIVLARIMRIHLALTVNETPEQDKNVLERHRASSTKPERGGKKTPKRTLTIPQHLLRYA
jgi:hypothetical protein